MYTDQSQRRAIAVGDIKLYAKWSHDRWKSYCPEDRIDFRQVLAQINYYMRKRHCLFAVVINEVECTAVYRVPGYRGYLKLSKPFPIAWEDGTESVGRETMTADFAIFCLSLLAQ